MGMTLPPLCLEGNGCSAEIYVACTSSFTSINKRLGEDAIDSVVHVRQCTHGLGTLLWVPSSGYFLVGTIPWMDAIL